MAAELSRPRSHGCTAAHPQALARIQPSVKRNSQRWFMATSAEQAPRLVALSPSGRWLQTAIGALLAGLCLGCVGSGEGVPAPPESGTVPTTWPQIQAQILGPTCAQPCHHGGAAPKGLSLDDAGALQNLVGVASAELPSMQRVAPGRPDDSYLFVKVAGADPRRVGARMPRTGPPFLTNGQIAALRKWIAAGATADWDANAVDAGSTMMPGSDVDAATHAQEDP